MILIHHHGELVALVGTLRAEGRLKTYTTAPGR
jgi:hypothetical protein